MHTHTYTPTHEITTAIGIDHAEEVRSIKGTHVAPVSVVILNVTLCVRVSQLGAGREANLVRILWAGWNGDGAGVWGRRWRYAFGAAHRTPQTHTHTPQYQMRMSIALTDS